VRLLAFPLCSGTGSVECPLKANSESNQLGQSERKREVASLHTHTHTRRHSATSYISSEIAKSAVLLLASTVMGEGVIISSIGCSLFVANKKKGNYTTQRSAPLTKKKRPTGSRKTALRRAFMEKGRGKERKPQRYLAPSFLPFFLFRHTDSMWISLNNHK
jgi:hypothetical protein